MRNRRNYYRILKIQPDAPVEVVRSSYRTLMRHLKLHPDLGGAHWDATVLNEAYETLMDSERRRQYDRKLFEQYTQKISRPESSDKRPLITLFCPFCKRPLARKARPDETCATCRSPLASGTSSPPREGRAGEKARRAWRRVVERRRKSEPIAYCSSWPQKARPGKMIDLSPRGMRFLCLEPLVPGSDLKIRCAILKATARVTHCTRRIANGKAHYSVGVSFLTVRFESAPGAFVSTSA